MNVRRTTGNQRTPGRKAVKQSVDSMRSIRPDKKHSVHREKDTGSLELSRWIDRTQRCVVAIATKEFAILLACFLVESRF